MLPRVRHDKFEYSVNDIMMIVAALTNGSLRTKRPNRNGSCNPGGKLNKVVKRCFVPCQMQLAGGNAAAKVTVTMRNTLSLHIFMLL